MVENSVKYYAYPILVKPVADKAERIVISEAAVDFFIINGIVAMFNGLKNRSEVYGIYIHLLEMRSALRAPWRA